MALDDEARQEVNDLAYIWTREVDQWVLLNVAASDEPRTYRHCFPVHLLTHGGLLIEDESVAQEVKRRMYEAGVPIVDQLPWATPRD